MEYDDDIAIICMSADKLHALAEIAGRESVNSKLSADLAERLHTLVCSVEATAFPFRNGDLCYSTEEVHPDLPIDPREIFTFDSGMINFEEGRYYYGSLDFDAASLRAVTPAVLQATKSALEKVISKLQVAADSKGEADMDTLAYDLAKTIPALSGWEEILDEGPAKAIRYVQNEIGWVERLIGGDKITREPYGFWVNVAGKRIRSDGSLDARFAGEDT